MTSQSDTLRDGAIALHELYLCYCEAGFSEEQAMALVTTMLLASLRGEVVVQP